METTTSSTPLWLDIKTVYIDENFDKVLSYLQTCSAAKETSDSFYTKTLELLDRRVRERIDEIASRPVFMDDDEELNKENLSLNVRMFGAYLLIRPDADAFFRQMVSAYMSATLSLLVPMKYSAQLIGLAVDIIAGRKGFAKSFGWADLTAFQPQVLAHKIILQSFTAGNAADAESYYGKGFMEIRNGVISVYTKAGFQKEAGLVRTIGIFDDAIQIMAPKNLKIKQSDTGNLERYREFTEEFISLQQTGTPLKSYSNGDTLHVRITEVSHKKLMVRSIDPKYAPFEGTVQLKAVLYFTAEDFSQNLSEGDEICVEILDIEEGTCSIENEFVHFIIDEWAHDDFGEQVVARYFDLNVDRNGRKKIVWLTEGGYCAYSNVEDGFHEGDYATIRIDSHGQDKYYGYINASVIEPSDKTFKEEDAKTECLAHFPYETSGSAYSQEGLPAGLVRELVRLLVSYQKWILKPSERYEILCVARILAELVEDREDSEYIKFISAYLVNLVYFAKGEISKMKDVPADESFAGLDPVRRKQALVKVLRCFGDDTKNEWLSGMISGSGDELLKKVSVLVQSCNRLDEIISKSMQNVIKREITKCLSIDTEGEADLEEENGTYLGIENSRQEFKTSFFIAPANAKEQDQRITIMKGICAFLNSSGGGTLYLGVNDLGYVQGIKSDIDYMQKRAYGNYRGVDGYIRYITDEAKKYFDISILTNVDIVDMYDSNVIAINIRPYLYGIVYLSGTPYIRVNSETVVMSETAKRQAIARSMNVSAGKTANASSVLDAIREKRKAVFHGYSSSNSGETADRLVEPFDITTNYTHITCYDIDKQRNAVFRTDRIRNVEVKAEGWEYGHLHKQLKMDAFHMTGEVPIRAVLKLDMMAKNLLCEEYPEAASSLSASDNSNMWILDIEVYKINGLGRFYLGLAGNIEIINAPELEEYAKNYIKEHLTY